MPIDKKVVTALREIESGLETRLQRFAEGIVESHRRRMWVRDAWCCEDMVGFAKDAWQLPNPPKSVFGGVQLQLRGSNVNYCPFCGVRV